MEGSTSYAPRFSSFSEEEKAALIEKVTPQSTKSATKFWVRVVCDFAREKGISFDFATIEEGQLARLLEDFSLFAPKERWNRIQAVKLPRCPWRCTA